MATIDICLPEEDIGGSATLKFWDRHARRLSYTLSTVVNDPHGYVSGICEHGVPLPSVLVANLHFSGLIRQVCFKTHFV